MAHFLKFTLDLPLVLFFCLLELSLKLLKPIFLLEISDFQMLVPFIFLEELFHLLRGLYLTVFEIKELAQLLIISVCLLVSFLKLFDSLLLLLDLIFFLTVLDMST
jgi:hypothetical protein